MGGSQQSPRSVSGKEGREGAGEDVLLLHATDRGELLSCQPFPELYHLALYFGGDVTRWNHKAQALGATRCYLVGDNPW